MRRARKTRAWVSMPILSKDAALVAVYVVGGQWDEHRNTSRVFGVPPTALPDALKALAKWRAANPAHAAWIAEGAPHLTHEEHVRRFGAPYQRLRSQRARGLLTGLPGSPA